MAASSITVTHPESGDVRVIPAELEKRYIDRGFKKAGTQSKGKAAAESSK